MSSPHRHPDMRVGSFLGDLFSPVTDVFSSVVDRVPGSDWVKATFDQGGTWIKDFANFSVGEGGSQVPIGYLVITIASGGAFQAVSPIVGPQVASVLWTVPDLIRGDTTFTQAYASEFLNRLTALIKYFMTTNGSNAAAAGATVNAQVTEALTRITNDPQFKALFNLNAIAALRASGLDPQAALAKLGLTPQAIAARFGVREDVAAMAIDAAMHEFVYDFSSAQNDPATGRMPAVPVPISTFTQSVNAKIRPPTAPGPTGGQSATDLLGELLAAQNNEPGNFRKIAALEAAYLAQKAREDAGAAAPAPIPPGAVSIALGPPLSVMLGPSLPGTSSAPELQVRGGLGLALFLTAPAWATWLVVHHLRGRRS